MKRLFLIACVACSLVGCNWVRLLEFRGQLKRLAEFTRWEQGERGQVLVFSDPVLSLADLQALRLAPYPDREGWHVIRYRYQVADGGAEGDAAMFFQLEQGRLKRVAFPGIILEMIGQRNLELFLRLAGGDTTARAEMGNVDKVRVLRAAFGPSVPPMGFQRIGVTLTPRDEANVVLKILFEEGRKPGVYSLVTLTVGRGGSGPQVSAMK